MRVLFIYTDVGISVGYSCGVGVLSAYLKQHGHETRLIHVSEELGYALDLERILQDVREYDPGLIAFSAMTNQWYYVKQVAGYLRRFLDTPIIVGGHHADAVPEQVVCEPAVDYVCKGEGERPLLELVNRLAAGEPTDDIPNIVWKKPAGPAPAPAKQSGEKANPGRGAGADGRCDQIIDNKMGRWVQNLDELPYEDREIFDYERIVESRYGWAEVIASRGCPYACTYCFNQRFFARYQFDTAGTADAVTMKDFVRRRSPAALAGMLKQIKQRYPAVKFFTFVDDIFAIDRSWLAELAPLYVREVGLPFACTSHPQAFNRKIARLLKEMGCKVVKMGIEAGNERIRTQVLNRKMLDEVLIRSFALARDYGLKPQAFNMIGLPTETRQNMMETVRLNAQVRAYIVWVSVFMPYPGTALHQFCLDNDLLDPQRWDDVRSYRGGTVLKETSFTHLELEKVRVLFRAYLNAFLENDCSADYRELAEELEAAGADDWSGGKAEQLFQQRDAELDGKWRRREVDHYVLKKYINMLWAKEYDYDIS